MVALSVSQSILLKSLTYTPSDKEFNLLQEGSGMRGNLDVNFEETIIWKVTGIINTRNVLNRIISNLIIFYYY